MSGREPREPWSRPMLVGWMVLMAVIVVVALILGHYWYAAAIAVPGVPAAVIAVRRDWNAGRD